MGILRSNKRRQGSRKIDRDTLSTVRVLDIILDSNHPMFNAMGGYDSIGTIFYTVLDDGTPDQIANSSNHAKPLFSYLKYYPLINEIVLLIPTHDKNIYAGKTVSSYYLPNINMWNHPHHNALPSISDLTNESEKTAEGYKETDKGFIRNSEEGEINVPLGGYFKEKLNIKSLLPYEGDHIIEGRFGNSIRFGSTNIGDKVTDKNRWSTTGSLGDPIIVIRNGQSKELDEKGWIPTIEDIVFDDSSIYLTSNQQLTDFIPASLHAKSYGANLVEPQTLLQKLTEPPPSQPETTPSLPNTDIAPNEEPPLEKADNLIGEDQILKSDEELEGYKEEMDVDDYDQTPTNYDEEITDPNAPIPGEDDMVIDYNQLMGDINTEPSNTP